MGGAARPLHDAGNDRFIERGSNLQATRYGTLTTPAKPAGERENATALTPHLGTRSWLGLIPPQADVKPFRAKPVAVHARRCNNETVTDQGNSHEFIVHQQEVRDSSPV